MTDAKLTPLPQITGRGAQINPNNRFSKIQIHEDLEQVEHDEYADHLRSTFKLFAQHCGLNGKPMPLDSSKFHRPSSLPNKFTSGQMTLFDLND